MTKNLLLVLTIPFLLGASLAWDPVTTDITGAPETPQGYRCYSRKLGTSDSWFQFGFTIHPITEINIPTPSAKQEYRVTAVDMAGNESEPSVAVAAKPETPGNPKVNR